jgi:hypothetical protein
MNTGRRGFLWASAGAGAKLAAVVNRDGTITMPHPSSAALYFDLRNRTRPGIHPPADGDIPHNGLVSSQGGLRVFIGSDFTDQIPLQGTEQRNANGDVNFIAFSGLSPNFPGMWQINVRIPMATAPGAQPLGLLFNSFPDNTSSISGYRIVFYVAQ